MEQGDDERDIQERRRAVAKVNLTESIECRIAIGVDRTARDFAFDGDGPRRGDSEYDDLSVQRRLELTGGGAIAGNGEAVPQFQAVQGHAVETHAGREETRRGARDALGLGLRGAG